jgi:hypothetical protein
MHRLLLLLLVTASRQVMACHYSLEATDCTRTGLGSWGFEAHSLLLLPLLVVGVILHKALHMAAAAVAVL